MFTSSFARASALVVSFALFLSGCTQDAVVSSEPVKPPFERTVNDRHSFSNINQVRVTHMDLKLAVDMKDSIIRGEVIHTLIRRDSSQQDLVLDIDTTLNIKKVSLVSDTLAPLAALFTIGEKSSPVVGQSLRIRLDQRYSKVRIEYETHKDAAALAWIPAAQTNGKTAPFLYTQGEATATRSWIPCQDSPSVRSTFKADVTVPDGLLALMSTDSPKERNARNSYQFEQKIPVPAYLVTLAVGDFIYHSTGKRTGVYAEKVDIDMAAKQFEKNELFIDVAEDLYGPYQWGTFNLLIMPPNYPYGGMENPSLIYFSRANLDGTNLNNYVVAHELMHFWFGNLVTNATWEDFWLNEGPTTYAEGRLIERVYGHNIADLLGAWKEGSLAGELKRLPPEDTRLALDLSNRPADDGLTGIPYFKGSLLFRTMEMEVGRENLDIALKNYLKKFEFQSVDAVQFQEYIRAELKRITGKPLEIDLKKWIYEPGMPNDTAYHVSPEATKIIQMYQSFKAGKLKLADVDTSAWTPFELQVFTAQLPMKGLTDDQVKELDAKFGLSMHPSEYVKMRWFGKMLGEHYEMLKAEAEKFMMEASTAIALPERFVPSLVTYPEGLKLARKFYDARNTEIHNLNRPGILKMITDAENKKP